MALGVMVSEASDKENNCAENGEAAKVQQPQRTQSLPQQHPDQQASGDSNDTNNTKAFCFECNRSLSRSRHLVNVAGKGHRWHSECFRCHLCKVPLELESSCHVYGERIICVRDYAKLRSDANTCKQLESQSRECCRCKWTIAPSDWVRRVGHYVYHLACFSCDICMRQLGTGEQFIIDELDDISAGCIRIVCKRHFRVHEQATAKRCGFGASTARRASNRTSDLSTPPCEDLLALGGQPTSATSPATARELVSLDSQDGDKLENLDHHHHHQRDNGDEDHFDELPLSYELNSPSINSGSEDHHHHHDQRSNNNHHHQAIHQFSHAHSLAGGAGSGQKSLISSLASKSKRVRTTFTEDQLTILQSHFQRDSNPDGQDLERIATVTGLSKRVTQVWFQNSRARQKKYLIKRKPGSVSSCSVATNAGPQLVGPTVAGAMRCGPPPHPQDMLGAPHADAPFGMLASSAGGASFGPSTSPPAPTTSATSQHQIMIASQQHEAGPAFVAGSMILNSSIAGGQLRSHEMEPSWVSEDNSGDSDRSSCSSKSGSSCTSRTMHIDHRRTTRDTREDNGYKDYVNRDDHDDAEDDDEDEDDYDDDES